MFSTTTTVTHPDGTIISVATVTAACAATTPAAVAVPTSVSRTEETCGQGEHHGVLRAANRTLSGGPAQSGLGKTRFDEGDDPFTFAQMVRSPAALMLRGGLRGAGVGRGPRARW